VQRYAVGLARELGVVDQALLKAIEAAALLHDMGKLAVPEYILNKPGRLTEAEFEKMKLHASVGADILSAIDFPYPVVPIVRHHHESWNGTGYPDGLRGTEIPIGARILSVVDCFDALTSDRPYRRQLSDEDALQILNERKGTMYDPWVVETFERVHTTLDCGAVAETSAATASAPPVRKEQPEVRAATQRSSPADSLALSNVLALECEALLLRLAPSVSASLALFYRYDSSNDELVAHQIASDGITSVAGMRMSLGQNLSGWVAANRQMIVNSDAGLDLGDLAETFKPPLRHCLSVPVSVDTLLIGVVSLYSSHPFTPDDERICRDMVSEIVEGSRTCIAAVRPTFAMQPAV